MNEMREVAGDLRYAGNAPSKQAMLIRCSQRESKPVSFNEAATDDGAEIWLVDG
jgi:hypothetical protein